MKVLPKEAFCFNKQQLTLIHTNDDGRSVYDDLPMKKDSKASSFKLKPTLIQVNDAGIQSIIAGGDLDEIRALISGDEHADLRCTPKRAYIPTHGLREPSCLVVRSNTEKGTLTLKQAQAKVTKTGPAQIKVTVDIRLVLEKDYEIIPYQAASEANQKEIQAFLDKWVTKRYELSTNIVGFRSTSTRSSTNQ
ncbi:MAG: hypothetical protein GYB18_08490 [Oceanospirillales bacterium]|nr:hypothetical protein [Oceanospirillales bacterium]